MRDLELPGRSTVLSCRAMAATSHPLSTQAAIEVLQKGGNAMDAAITASALQCVVEPQSTGIGGDCFCLYAPAGGGIVGFNGSGRAPAALSAAWMRDRALELDPGSPHAVTIPGAIDAWHQLLRDYGTLSLGEALQPAIRAARDGYPVTHRVHKDWAGNEDWLRADQDAAQAYLIDGKAPAYGSVQRQTKLAATLERIARDGRDAFYGGGIAADMVAKLQALGGTHTLGDFEAAAGEYVTPIKTAYRGHDVYECPPNGQGIAALAMLNILHEVDMAALGPVSAERYHLEIEAARFAYRDRDAMLADPAQQSVPVEWWLARERAADHRAAIDPHRAMDPLPPSDFPDHADTICLSVVDQHRNAVSFINSLFWGFGSGIVAPKSGITLHNRGLGFSLQRGHPRELTPGARPLHTIIPGMVMRDGRAVMPFGVMGGHYQAHGHAHLISNLLDFGMDLQQAIDTPRLFAGAAGEVAVERGISDEVRAGLERRGHRLVAAPKPIGGAQAVWIDRDSGVLHGGSDPRKDGQAGGY